MKNVLLAAFLFAGLLFSQKSNAQSVAIKRANIVTLSNAKLVYVTGTLTGVKGIPITGYTVDIISSDSKATRVVTNQPSSGGNFTCYGGVEAINGTAPYTIKVTTNRQVSTTASAKLCYSCK